MSIQTVIKRRTAASIQALKGERPVVCLTAYTAPVAKLLDPHCDLLLVGDSMGVVIYGLESSVYVTMEMMIAHGQAVMRSTKETSSSSTCPSAPTRKRRNSPFAMPPAS